MGVGDPPRRYVPIYFEELQNAWANARKENEARRKAAEAPPAAANPPAQEEVEVISLSEEPVYLGVAETAAAEEPAASQDPEPLANVPALWGVIELFEQTSNMNEPFAARPATVTRMREQIRGAKPFFENLVFFAYPNYADPDLGGRAARLHKALTK